MTKRILLFLILVSCTQLLVLSQTRSLHSWTEATISYDLNKDIGLKYGQMVRNELFPLNPEVSLISELSADYKFNKHWKAGAECRLSFSPAEIQPRYAIFVRYRDGIGDFELQVRSKLQSETSQYELPVTEFRNKFSVGYELSKKLMPFVSYELFYRAQAAESNFNAHRTQAGFDYKFNKHHNISLGYMIDTEVYTYKPKQKHVISLSYAYEL